MNTHTPPMNAQAPSDLTLPPVAASIKHHPFIVAVSVFAGLGLMALYLFLSSPTFTSQATLLLRPVPGTPLTAEIASSSGTQNTIAMQTEAETVSTPLVAKLASAQAETQLPRDGDKLNASAPEATQSILISYTSDTPGNARDGAQVFADAFLTYRQQSASDLQERRMTNLSTQRKQAEEELRRASGTTEEVFAEQEVQLFTDRLAELNSVISSEQIVATDPGLVLNPASTPASRDGVAPWILLLAAAGAAAAIGVAFSILREWQRDLVRSQTDFSVGGIPVLATVPAIRSKSVARDSARAVEAHRRLRSGIVANCARPHALGIASVGIERAGPNTARALGHALLDAGFSVLLLNAAFGDHQTQSEADENDYRGLEDVLKNNLNPRDVIQSIDTLDTIGPGNDRASLRSLVAGPAMRTLIDTLRQEYDFVLIASASPGDADGDAALGAADSALLSVFEAETTHREITSSLNHLDQLGAPVVGIVIIPPSRHKRTSKSVDRNVDTATRKSGHGQ